MSKMVKRVLAALLTVVLVGGALPLVSIPVIASGNGSNGTFLEPIEPPIAGSKPISNRAELEDIKKNLSGNYHLTADIYLSSPEWVPIGDSSAPFTGIFDGQGHVIEKLRITGERYEHNGLFGYVNHTGYINTGVIKNVGLEDIYIDVARSSSSDGYIRAGGICGYGSARINNCYTMGFVSVTSTSSFIKANAGGISGYSSSIENCYNTGDIYAYSIDSRSSNVVAGGISANASFKNCYNAGKVIASANQGIIWAAGIGLGSATNCYNIGEVNGIIPTSSTSSGAGSTIHASGIGDSGNFINCYNAGVIFVSNPTAIPSVYAGGITSEIRSSYRVENCYNTGDISVNATRNSKGLDNIKIGGICGSTLSGQKINNCYNVGSITVSDQAIMENAGGICGNGSPSSITNCYAPELYGSEYGIQLTPVQMKIEAYFKGWDFDTVWDISSSVNDGHPFLRNMPVAVEDENTVMTLDYLKDVKFPQGKYWNKMGLSTNNQNGYTNTPCPQVFDGKEWRHVSGTSTCNGFAPNGTQLSWQCWGFTEKLAFDLYDENPRQWSRINTLTDIKPGDHIRYNGHSVFAIAVNDKKVFFADCNSDRKCGIRWDRTRTRSSLAANLTWVKSAPYPANQVFTIAGRRVRIACPVDVEVYDDLGRLAARIINNVVDYGVDEVAGIAAWVEGDEKYFDFGGGFEYTFKLIGTDAGVMNVEISDIELISETIGKQKKFINVSLEDDKRFEFTLGDLDSTDASTSKIFVVDKEGTRISEIMEDGTENSDGVGTPDISVTGITLSSNTLSMNYKATDALVATVTPDNATNKTVTWKSDNEKVATIDANGSVQAVGRGTAKITATTDDGQKTASCEVTVKYAWWQWIIIIIFFGWLWY